MKKISYFFSFIVVSLVLMACNDDFMDRFPPNSINDGTYWQSVNDLQSWVNQYYGTVEGWATPYNNDDQSDNQCSTSQNAVAWGNYPIPASGGGWSFGTIRSVNYFLEHYQNVPIGGEADRKLANQYLGEALVIKASNYFDLVKRFGDVPWLDKVVSTADDDILYAPRDSRTVVIANVLKDLDEAIGYLPATSNELRLTKYMALALKARICLYEGTFRKYHNAGEYQDLLNQCANACDQIINSGKFALYGEPVVSGDTWEELCQAAKPWWEMWIQKDGKDVSQYIGYVHYVQGTKMHGRAINYDRTASGFCKDLIESYLCIDGKPIANNPLYKGDANYDDEFVNRDPRMYWSVLTNDKPYLIATADGNITYKPCPLFGIQETSTGYRKYKLFSPYEEDFQNSGSYYDVPIFNYAEVLLSYAEAKAELGSCTQADLDKSINKLRARVGMPNMTVNVGFTDPNWPAYEGNPSDLIKEIRRERRIELLSEGGRWNDLMRWKAGKLLENEKTWLGALDPATGKYYDYYNASTNQPRKWNDKQYLFPLPLNELTLNPNLKQNPGW